MRISYVTAAYNNEFEVKAYLNSMKKVVTKNDEMLIIDDKSTDKTVELINNYRGDLPIRLILNKENLGMPKNCNKAMKEAEGDVIAWSDFDYYFPNRGDVIRRYFNKDYDLIHTSFLKDIEGEIRLSIADKNFDHRGKSKIQMSTVVEDRKNALKYPFDETYPWHNLYFERFLRMKKDSVRMLPINIITTIWKRLVGNYDRRKNEIEIIQKNIYKEYGIKI